MSEHAPPENAKAARQGDFASESTVQEYSHEGAMTTSRNRPHRGWFPVSEEAIRQILQRLDDPGDARAAILAYVTFCRKVNLRGSETFEDTIRNVGVDMAYGPREARKAVALLEDLKLVRVQRRRIPGTKANAPSIYTVRRLVPNAPSLEQRDGRLGKDGLHTSSPEYSQELPQKPPIPSIQEAEEFLRGQRLPIDAVPEWLSHRESQNWQKTSGVSITNWQADLKAWVYRNARTNKGKGAKPPEKSLYANEF